MASFRNRHGTWQARVQRKGQQPITKSFQSKEDAQRWARQVEADPPSEFTHLGLTDPEQLARAILKTVSTQ
jgi:hypothetical protein